jgi:hypothetical protein
MHLKPEEHYERNECSFPFLKYTTEKNCEVHSMKGTVTATHGGGHVLASRGGVQAGIDG